MKKIIVLSLCLLFMAFAMGANAANFTVYDDFFDFLDVCPDILTENFEDATLIPGLSIAEPGGAGTIANGVYYNNVDDNPVKTQTFSYSQMGGFGVFINLKPLGKGTEIQVSADGANVGIIPYAPYTQYFAFTSDTPFTDVKFSTPAGRFGTETYYIVDMHLCPTPIPGSLLLLGSGIIGLVGVGLRKQSSL